MLVDIEFLSELIFKTSETVRPRLFRFSSIIKSCPGIDLRVTNKERDRGAS